MDTSVFFAVLAAALMHGGWNVLVKLKLDRFLSLFLVQMFMGLVGLGMIALFPLPSLASLPYALTSGVLHTGYNLFLARSYRTGDLSLVYPIARGSAPLLTYLGAYLAAGEAVTPLAAFGIGVLVVGIWLTAAGSKALRPDAPTLFFALGTSLFIAAYTIVDGLGGRLSGSPTGYAGLLYVLDALLLLAIGLGSRGSAIVSQVAPYWRTGIFGGALSAGAYWIVIWAMTVAPIAVVAALRETSILFVIAMSALILNERVGRWRILGGALIVAGAVALRLA